MTNQQVREITTFQTPIEELWPDPANPRRISEGKAQ